MNELDRAMNALRKVFPEAYVSFSDGAVMSLLDGRVLESMKPKPCYRFGVRFPNGKVATAGCWFTDEFFEMFSDDELVEAFRQRFVIPK